MKNDIGFKNSTKKIDYIQYFRGIAILYVVLAHSTHHGFSNDIGIKIIDLFIWYGQQGVTLFFVISAFTIFYSIESKYNVEKNNYLNFMIRRFFRIAPLYYLGIIVYGLILRGNNIFDFKVIFNFLFIHWINPKAIESIVPGGWSITTEFTFYFFAPLLFKYITTINKAVTTFLISIILSRFAVSILSRIYPLADNGYLIMNPLSHFPVFICGIILYFLVIHNEAIRLKKIDCILISMIILLDFLFGRDTLIREHYLGAILFASLVYVSSQISFNHFISKPLAFIGELSFTIYITHFLIIEIIKKYHLLIITSNIFIDWGIRFGFVLGGAILISVPIYYLIEKPMIELGKKLTKVRQLN